MENLNEEEEEINVLPKASEIPKQSPGFIIDKLGLGFQIQSQNHLLQLNSLHHQITSDSNYLNHLHKNLGNLLISWSSRWVRAKTCLHDFASNLDNHYGSETLGEWRIEKIVAKDLPYIANELRRIETLRNYAVVALKLEGLVGDLEDAALSNLNQPTGSIYLKNGPSSSISGDCAKLENVHRAVKAIRNIEELLEDVLGKHPHWCNLLKAVDTRVDKILSVLRPQVLADHRSLLASLGWPPKLTTSNLQNGEATSIPNPLVLMQGVQKQRYSESFIALCALQHVQSRREERLHSVLAAQKREEHVGLWAIDELVTPIASRINHHLMKWTDRPEFIFALAYKITHNFIEGVDDVLQPLIDEARLISCSAKESWVSAMVQVLAGFLAKSVLPILVERYRDKNSKSDAISSWLHLIDLIVKFEKRAQSLVSSETYISLGEVITHTGFTRAMSLLSLFCDRPDWLHIWAKVELKDAWKKLKAELKNENAWSTGQQKEREGENYFLSTRDDHKAPLVSEFALKQAWDMIERCRTLPGTSCRIRFIRSSVKKFLGQFREVMVLRHDNSKDGTYGFDVTLVRVCQLINVARYLEFRLREWSDDVDLLELKLAEKGVKIDPNGSSSDTNCFFEEEIDQFVEMQTDWLMEIITDILCEYENLSYYYFQYVDRFEVGPSNHDHVAGTNMMVSDDLAEALDNLRTRLLLVKEHLNASDFLDVWRSVAEGLDRFTFRSILSVGIHFSDEGAKQLMADVRGLFLVFQAFCARPEAFFPCIRGFRKLLSLGKEDVDDLKSKLVDNEKGCECLLSCNISNLSVDQALTILNNRTFLV